jgi:probable phosphoglycerate mutase
MRVLPGTETRRRIYLMRHGHVDYLNRKTVESGAIHAVDLTPRGRMQAAAAGRALARVEIDRAICSGYPRTRQTAEGVLAARDNPPAREEEPALVEVRGGKMPPVKSRAELIRFMSANSSRKLTPDDTMYDGGEVYAHAQARAVGAIERLLQENSWHTALIVAHEGLNRLILSWACGAGLGAMGAFEQDTGCINVIDFDREGADGAQRILIKAVNLTPYNWLKHGMNLTSLEALFERDINDKPPE